VVLLRKSIPQNHNLQTAVEHGVITNRRVRMDYGPELGDNIEALNTLAHMGYLNTESVAFRIAQKWLHDGENSLSEKQLYLFNKEIRPVIAKSCGGCGNGIELSALPNAYETGKMLCSSCMYRYQKND
jgi:formylmethanofuran dehydrogenase subunit E